MSSRRKEGEHICRVLGKALEAELSDLSTGPRMGFGLMLFDFPGDPRAENFCAWISNANRQDMIKLLREQADRLEAGTADTKGSS